MKVNLNEPWKLKDFEGMNEWVQTPEHPINFFRTLIVKHLSNSKIIYLVGRKYSEVDLDMNGESRQERIIEDDDEIRELIRDKFKLLIEFEKFQPKDIYTKEMDLRRIKEEQENKTDEK